MKFFITMALMFCSLAAFAKAKVVEAGYELDNYECKLIENPSVKYSIVIKTTQTAKVDEMVMIPAELTLKRVYPIGTEVRVLPTSYRGVYSYEDVMTNFVSKNSKVSFRLYADELDQTSLTTPDGRLDLDCNPEE